MRAPVLPEVTPLPGTENVHDDVPKDFRPKTDVTVDQTAREALDVSAEWQHDEVKPVSGADGRVVYSFGAGLPTVVCAPLRLCMIELQSGEHIAGETAHW